MINSDINFELPYITADLPGVGGVLRSSPEHFVVQEVPLYEPSGEGQHLYVNLTKVGLTTKELQRSLAKLFQVESGSVGYAGMKDKHARTTQTFSLPLGHIDSSAAEEACKRIDSELPVLVHWAKLHGNKLKAGHLLGNRFQISISQLVDGESQDLFDRANAIVEQIRQGGVPNYFGPQRFGLNGENVGKGQSVLLGKRWIKDRWLRRFLVSSYQSYLCNQYLSLRVKDGSYAHLLKGDVAKKYDTGGIFDVDDLEAEQIRYQNQEISFTAPMYGPKMRAATDAAGLLEDAVLERSGITLNHLRKAKVNGTRRLGRVLIPDITVQLQHEQLIVEFFLPKGAFATTILREIMKVDLDTAPDIE